MGTQWVWFVTPSGQAPGVTELFEDEQDKHQPIWQRQKAVPQLLKSSQLGLISPLSVKLQLLSSSGSSQFIRLVIFKCPDLLNHSLDG